MKNYGKIWRIVCAVAATIGIMLFFVTCWTAAFFLTSYLFNKMDWRPDEFTKQIINSVFGFFILGIIMFCVGALTAPRRMEGFRVIIDALRRIAKGDFNINLDNKAGGHPLGKIVEGINQMAEELSQMERMRQEFISNVSHEIQSPLTSIGGFAKVLQNEGLSPEERRHYLGIIESESMRLSKVSENLLKLTSLESEHHPFEPVWYRLDKQVRSIILSCEPLWVDKAIEMDVTLEEVSIVADKDLMSQVWVNLINNSIKFAPHGGVIGVHLYTKDRAAAVRISDNGIGISEEDQAHIFERFYKADKSRYRAGNGSGLGLAIVSKIVAMHKGDISVESKLGEGTTFIISLPT